jgi:two-component system alkaline phosphatase synthesis response regulator PhoP
METNPVYKILVVDDNPDIVELLEYNLTRAGYQVKTAHNGVEAVKMATSFSPHLVLMDIMMPKMDGIEAGRQIRQLPQTANTCLMYLTAREEEYSEIAAFDIGADDYITKPVRIRSLLSRINAALKRVHKSQNKQQNKHKVLVGNLTIDRESYLVYLHDIPLKLPKKEFELLYFLAKAPDKVFTRDELLLNVWGSDIYVTERTVDVHIRKLREKVGQSAIQTVKGVGYRLVVG